jgi:hypothetical protein
MLGPEASARTNLEYPFSGQDVKAVPNGRGAPSKLYSSTLRMGTPVILPGQLHAPEVFLQKIQRTHSAFDEACFRLLKSWTTSEYSKRNTFE